MERVALIAGASGGLGGAVVEAFAGGGWRVAAVARRAIAERERVASIAADLTDEKSAAAAVAQAAGRFGRLDAVVNLAGGWRGGEPVERMATDTWRAMLSVNLDAALFLARAAVAPLRAAGGGRILFVGSWAATHPMAGSAAYVVAKAGLHALAGTLAEELRDGGITVNVVAPRLIDTAANRAAMGAAAMAAATPPEAIARVLLFLASPEAAAVTGAVVPV